MSTCTCTCIHAGLNPLIYTISAVILLGTLAIVAIITCWIRARRSYNRRMFQANTDPQDYLDYISDNEFTPLTTSEFVASLQERPPTYHESEEIEGQNRDDNEGAESSEGGNSGGTGGTSTTPATTAPSAGRSTGNTRTAGSSRTPPARPPPPTNSTTPRARPQTTPTNGVSVSGTRPHRWNNPGLGGVEEAVLVRTSPSPVSDVTQSTGTTQASATSDDISSGTGDQAATGVSSSEPVLGGVDALLTLDVGTMEVARPWSLEPLPPPSSSSDEPSTAVGTLIDLDLGPSPDSGSHVVSDSQSTFQTLPQPTPEQISEIEAAIGAINKHMTEIRERTE